MCGRYSFAQLSLEVEKRFKIHVDGNTYVAKYNAAPGQKLGIISNEKPNELSFHYWGLLPPWAKELSMAYKMINARGESIHEKPAFRSAFKSKRCLIPADGFYEWKKQNKQKIPHFFRLKTREMFAFAGLWEEWKDTDGRTRRTFTIITTEANTLMQNLHHRMPVILPKHLEYEWLDNPNIEDLRKLILPFDSSKMESYKVSAKVNNVKNDAPSLMEPDSAGEQTSLF